MVGCDIVGKLNHRPCEYFRACYSAAAILFGTALQKGKVGVVFMARRVKPVSRRSFVALVSGGVAATMLSSPAAAQQTGRTDSDPNDRSGYGSTGYSDSDANDRVGHGRTGLTDSDTGSSADQSQYGRGGGNGVTDSDSGTNSDAAGRGRGEGTGYSDSDPNDRSGYGRSGITDGDDSDQAGRGRGRGTG